ncbi:GMC oxidoreductase [Bradyrhizobium sp. WD16]|uniref:GMC oxidoreductase n=1 Tax=Bradyrhizobium sp. WD16 TaxID=1521768 RepID=UPI0020A275ED|nr:GMC family oxidoreductase [Bradyrhizobium sp. WD16]UTD27775.1 dehydrogenase [Bradyrhizobium sp. WD16]
MSAGKQWDFETKPDVVIIGSGVGGSSVALKLAATGAKILIVERGEKLPNEPENADAEAVFVQSRYRTTDLYRDETGRSYRPGQYYYVGGHTKFYGTAMFRFRERDFAEVVHEDGVSPQWPVSYSALEPFYSEAESLFGVRGRASDDPTDPPRSAAYRHEAIPHEPVIGKVAAGFARLGLHPFHMPSAIDYGPGGLCRRCGTCDAFACRFDAKGDAETRLLRPALQHPNVSLLTGARVRRLISGADGREIVAAEIERAGEIRTTGAPLFILSAGAINSALILLRSADEKNPDGIANSSGVVGRYLMNHHLSGLMGLMPFAVNETRFPKTLSINDFYHGLPGDEAARGNVQMLGNIQGPMIRAAYPWMPGFLANLLARHSVNFLVMSEDTPKYESRVRPLEEYGAEVIYRPGDRKAHERFVRHMRSLLKKNGFPIVLGHSFGIEGPSHQCGTVRMGNDPKKSALDEFCRAHDHTNLYVVDAGFFPSSAALNPALTVAAQALRVGEHLRESRFSRRNSSEIGIKETNHVA